MLDLNRTILVMPGSIRLNGNVVQTKVTDETERRRQYLDSIRWSIENTDFKKIVFCDNSGQPTDAESMNLARQNGKELEWLVFNGDQEQIERHGKGYGEGEILNYAINHSHLIDGNSYLCKLTGRLKVENINRFLYRANPEKTYFWTIGLNIRRIVRGIDTRFYGMPVETYLSWFSEAYKRVDDRGGIT